MTCWREPGLVITALMLFNGLRSLALFLRDAYVVRQPLPVCENTIVVCGNY